MGSVKTLAVDEPASDEGRGRGLFAFSDDYSVFDWGKMPDPIPRKGESLAAMGAHTFEEVEAEGISTHYRGLVEDGEEVSLPEMEQPSRRMAIELVQVPDLPFGNGSYDYDAYQSGAQDHVLVPLEIVFRNDVPIGSSLRRRTEPDDHGLGYDEWPNETLDLDEPIVEFSTKFEEQDRYLSEGEAGEIAWPATLDELEEVARRVNGVINDIAREAGLVHHDGKIECLYSDGEIMVADVAGTFDENRFSYDGVQTSKEVLRQYYKAEHTDWADAVSDAKQTAQEEGVEDWRTLLSFGPDALPGEIRELGGDVYTAGANAYTGRNLFEAPPLATVVEDVQGREWYPAGN